MSSSFIYHCNTRIGVRLCLVDSLLNVREFLVWDESLLDLYLFSTFPISLFIENIRRIDILGRNILTLAWLSPL